VFAIVVAIVGSIRYEVYVPGQTKEVFGSVVSLQQIANNSQPAIRSYATVELENGFTVQARVNRYVTLVPGDRAAVLEITTPLFGFKRYQFHRHLSPNRSRHDPPTTVVSP
jgi:hypothetical protein